MFLAALAVLFKISISVIDILDFKAIFIFQPFQTYADITQHRYS